MNFLFEILRIFTWVKISEIFMTCAMLSIFHFSLGMSVGDKVSGSQLQAAETFCPPSHPGENKPSGREYACARRSVGVGFHGFRLRAIEGCTVSAAQLVSFPRVATSDWKQTDLPEDQRDEQEGGPYLLYFPCKREGYSYFATCFN